MMPTLQTTNHSAIRHPSTDISRDYCAQIISIKRIFILQNTEVSHRNLLGSVQTKFRCTLNRAYENCSSP